MAKITAELVAPPQPNVEAIYENYAAKKEQWDSLGINVGDIDLGIVGDATMNDGFVQGFVALLEIHIFSDNADRNLTLGIF